MRRDGMRRAFAPGESERRGRRCQKPEGTLTADAPTAAAASPETVKRKVQAFIDETGADELILASHIFDEDKRMRSYEIAAEVRESLTPAKAASITS